MLERSIIDKLGDMLLGQSVSLLITPGYKLQVDLYAGGKKIDLIAFSNSLEDALEEVYDYLLHK